MRITVKDAKETEVPCDVLILPLFEDEGMKPYRDLDRALGGLPGKIVSSREFKGKPNEAYLMQTFGKIKPGRVLFAGLGKKAEVTAERLRQAGGSAAKYLTGLGMTDAAVSARNIKGLAPADFVEGCLLAEYRFETYKKEEDGKELKSIGLIAKGAGKALASSLKRVRFAARAAHFARDLVNTPSKDLTPSALVRAARSINGVKVKVIERREVEKLGMGAFLSVARGSMEPPKFIVVSYNGAGVGKGRTNAPPVALVGKSITFDSGGLSLKPGKSMETMKYDMAGGAAVLGALKAASELKLRVNAVGILPATENLPGQSPSKPGDVVRAMGGKTIEILNTDAEGRLALADAIGYAKTLKPRAVVDIATLTGSCAVALGNEAMAMMGNDEEVVKHLEDAAEETSERVWRMPLYDEYKEYLKSEIADLRNISTGSGGLVTAGYFLKEFAGDVPWAHLDIANTAWTDKDRPYTPKGATGIGVRLLLAFLRRLSA